VVEEGPGGAESLVRPVIYYGGPTEPSDHDEWKPAFRIAPVALPADAKSLYIGFSGYTGRQNWMEVDLHRLETTNFDPLSMGEESNDGLDAWREVIQREKRFVDQASQKEAVQKLTELLRQYNTDYTTIGGQLSNSLVELDNRLNMLANDMNGYMHLVDAWQNDRGQFDPEAVKGHIMGIKTMLTSHGKDQSAKLDQLSPSRRRSRAGEVPASFGRGNSDPVSMIFPLDLAPGPHVGF